MLPFSPLLKNQMLIHCGNHLQLMILGTLIGPQVYQFSDLLSVHLAVSLFLLRHLLLLLFFSTIVSVKIVFCLWTWPGCIRGLQILDKTGGKIKSPSPPPIKDRKKHGAFLRFSTVVSARNVFRLWTLPG